LAWIVISLLMAN